MKAAKAPPSCLSSSQRGDAVTTSSSSGASAGASVSGLQILILMLIFVDCLFKAVA